MDVQAILFDFYGVLSRGRFYESTLLPEHQRTYEWIQSNVFSDRELIWRWMRNEIDSSGVNRLIAEHAGIAFKDLYERYEESIRGLGIDEDALAFARRLKSLGKKVGIVTDNMDVFTSIVIPKNGLDRTFDVIVNSADYGILKKDENGKLFDIALAELGVPIERSLMIDDSLSTIALYERKGGRGFAYKNFEGLEAFLSEDSSLRSE